MEISGLGVWSGRLGTACTAQSNLSYPTYYGKTLIKQLREKPRLQGSYTNWPVQLKKMTRNFKFRFKKEMNLYYSCSNNKGADQLCSYFTADMCLCFFIGNNHVSPVTFCKTIKIIQNPARLILMQCK